MKYTTTYPFKLFLLIFGIALISCQTSYAQSWTVSGDTISSTGTVKAGNLNVTGTCVKMPGIVTDTTTDIMGITKQGKMTPLNAISMSAVIYQTAPPAILTCDTTNPLWYKQSIFGGSALVTRHCTWVGVGEAGMTGFPDAPLSISNGNATTQFSVVSPTSSLDVFKVDENGNTYAAGNVGIATTTSSAQLAIKMPASPSIPAFLVANSTGSNIVDIASNGNVLIQTTNNEYALNVGGTIWSTEVQVCMSGCDFVFDKGYTLMPLKELENYLNLNHHLPGIASAKQMETNEGVALGKMDSQLLQKVEELTLYILQQQKQLDEQKEEIKDLKNVVNALQKK